MSATTGKPQCTVSRSFKVMGKDVDELNFADFAAAKQEVGRVILSDLVAGLAHATRNAEGFTYPPFCIGSQHFIPNGAATCICGKVQAE